MAEEKKDPTQERDSDSKEVGKQKKEEAPKEEPKDAPAEQEAAEKEVEVPKKFKDLVKQIEELSVADLAELVKVLEDKFGVSAVPMAAAPAGGGAGGAAEAGGEAGEEKSIVNLELTSSGDQKIAVVKVVKELSGLGLKEAKDLVDGAPSTIKEGVKREEAEEMKKKLEQAGAGVELK